MAFFGCFIVWLTLSVGLLLIRRVVVCNSDDDDGDGDVDDNKQA